jgi:hypothetical protein
MINESDTRTKHADHSPCEWSIIRIMKGILKLRFNATRFLAFSACFSEGIDESGKGAKRRGVVEVKNMERGARK